MLLSNLSELVRDPVNFMVVLLITAIALVIGITVHEFSHAWVSYRLGDNTAKSMGRVTLNPLAHLDPMGTIMLFLAGFGWGKPVPVNSYRLLQKGRSAMAKVSFAGPASNLITAAVFALAIRFDLVVYNPYVLHPLAFGFNPEMLIGAIFLMTIYYNILLAVFNLIPLPPLDGFNIALSILPRGLASSYSHLDRFGPMLLVMLVLFDYYFKLGILSAILSPVLSFVSLILLGNPL